MDSLTQLALGAAVGHCVAGRRFGASAAVVGAVLGTLPDLDVLIRYDDPVAQMTYHRGWSHSLFWLSLASVPITFLLSRWRRFSNAWRTLWMMVWLCLITHPLLDAMTIYGTQLLLPFSDTPIGTGSVFIIDPLVTVPIVVGLALAARRRWRQVGATVAGLSFAVVYLALGLGLQWRMMTVAQKAVPIANASVIALPTPLNTARWRLLAHNDSTLCEQFSNAWQATVADQWYCRERGTSYLSEFETHWPVARLAAFSKGWVIVEPVDNMLVIRDVRMGIPEQYLFSFRVAEQHPDGWRAISAEQLPLADNAFSRWRRAYRID
ncbi:MAG: metal-dependent hydrolase [Pseudomonadota bacterium]